MPRDDAAFAVAFDIAVDTPCRLRFSLRLLYYATLLPLAAAALPFFIDDDAVFILLRFCLMITPARCLLPCHTLLCRHYFDITPPFAADAAIMLVAATPSTPRQSPSPGRLPCATLIAAFIDVLLPLIAILFRCHAAFVY